MSSTAPTSPSGPTTLGQLLSQSGALSPTGGADSIASLMACAEGASEYCPWSGLTGSSTVTSATGTAPSISAPPAVSSLAKRWGAFAIAAVLVVLGLIAAMRA